MLIEENPTVRAAKDALWIAALNYNQGDLIPWEVIEAATGSNRKEEFCKRAVAWLSKRLRKKESNEGRGIDSVGEHGVGLRLLTPSEQIRAKHRIKRIGKQLHKKQQAIANVDCSKLSDYDARFRVLQLQATREELSRNRQAMKSVVGRVESIERQPMPATA